MVYEHLLEQPLPVGIAHAVYISDDFDKDAQIAREGGAVLLTSIAKVSAQFGDRRVAFMRAPGGWVVEFIEILRNLLPEV
jgi:hypothetical protein